VNVSEKKAKELFEKEGWQVIHCGAPDFLLIKRGKYKKTKNYKTTIEDVKFVEVKTTKDKLRPEQELWKLALEFIGVKYELKVIGKKHNVIASSKNELLCIVCGKHFTYKGTGRKPKYCKDCAYEIHKKQMRHNKEKYNKLGTTTLREFKYDNFWKEHKILQREKKKLQLEKRKCPRCGCEDIRFDKKKKHFFCFGCKFILEEKYNYIINTIGRNFERNVNYNRNPHPEQNDW